MPNDKKLALIIDDEPDLLSLLAISLGSMGIETVKAENISSAKQQLGEHRFDLCLTDLRLADGSGLEIIEHVGQLQGNTPIAVITAFGDPATAVKALKAGAYDYVCKPLEIEDLESLVKNALQHSAANGRKSEPGGEQNEHEKSVVLLGKSDAIATIRSIIGKVARNLAPVLISGETGTGKELIARMIHQQSARADDPFIAVNCGAIPKELMESQFFGHKKGSFTGAHKDTAGLFQAAWGGTLFLDEVAELPLELQVKLLRVIQEKRLRAVGDTTEVSTNIRLISATHRDLNRMIDNGSFREDFFYRINVIPIHAPPLRSRREDISCLVENFTHRISQQHGFAPPDFTSGALAALASHDFPGNVRELENILERAIALHENQVITEPDIMLSSGPIANPLRRHDHSALPIDNHILEVEKQRIRSALAENQGNITAAAKSLGTTFRSLRYRIKKLQIRYNTPPPP